jgi:tetratricopeptide (TPR) repeat protein
MNAQSVGVRGDIIELGAASRGPARYAKRRAAACGIMTGSAFRSVPAMLDEYLKLQLNGRLDEAESGYRALLASQPDNVDVLHMLGALRRQRRDYAEARLLFDRAYALAPDRADVLLDLAGLYLLDGDNVGARVTVERALALDPNLPGAYNLLAQLVEAQGDGAKAESLYRTSLRQREDDPIALGGLGRILLDRGELDKALSYLTAAADRAPKDGVIQLYLARALTLKGNTTFAEQAARNALALQPNLHAARFLLGQLVLEAGNVDEARAHFTGLLDVADFRAIALFGLGDVVRKSGDLEQAVALYRQALALQPRQVRAVQMLAGSLAALGREDEAVALYRQYLTDYPEELTIEAALGDLLSQLGDLAGAQAVWNQIAQRRPGDPTPLQRLALLHERFGDHAGADALAARVAEFTADDPDLILLRARSAQREGRDADAVALLETLRPLQLHPRHVSQAAHRYGVLADRRDDVAQALPAFVESQSMLEARVHEQPPLTDEFLARLSEPAPAPAGKAPVFLVGLPGSMVERVAALISGQPGVQLLRDRAMGTAQRRDDFFNPAFAAFTADPQQAAERRARWDAEAARTGADLEGQVQVDWLLRWDARFLPLIRHSFPGATLVIVEREDSRDLLVNWLAYGWLEGFPAFDPDAAATWLGTALEHTRICNEAQGLKVVRVDPDALFADPIGNGRALAQALGLAQLVPGGPQFGLGGLPLGLPPGRWQAYEGLLASTYAKLQSSR